MLTAAKTAQPLRPRIQPTTDQLHAAWLTRRRSHWPAEFSAVMDDPLLGRLVHMEAVRLILLAQRVARRQQLLQQAPRYTATRASNTALPAHPAPDRKRLAAGDTDDD